jgi:hypothetical protein
MTYNILISLDWRNRISFAKNFSGFGVFCTNDSAGDFVVVDDMIRSNLGESRLDDIFTLKNVGKNWTILVLVKHKSDEQHIVFVKECHCLNISNRRRRGKYLSNISASNKWKLKRHHCWLRLQHSFTPKESNRKKTHVCWSYKKHTFHDIMY